MLQTSLRLGGFSKGSFHNPHPVNYRQFPKTFGNGTRFFSSLPIQENFSRKLLIGQPRPETHSHLMKPMEITPGLTREEFKQRRQRFVEFLPERSVTVVPSFSERIMANDIPQQTDFLYLSGYQEPDSVLVFDKRNSEECTFTMFVRPRDPSREKWDGSRSGVEGALEVFGADQIQFFVFRFLSLEAFELDRLSDELQQMVERSGGTFLFDPSINPLLSDKIFTLLQAQVRSIYSSSSPHLCWIGVNVTEKWKGKVSLSSPTTLLESLRIIKSEAEIALLRRSGHIAAVAMTTLMKETSPGISEDYLAALMQFETRKRGAQRLAYPPVVAGGENALTLHYVTNDMILKNGDLVLVDAGCEYNGYTSDITRVWPVSGTFSPGQKAIYNIVLQANLECIKLCGSSNTSINSLHRHATEVLREGLRQLGIGVGWLGHVDQMDLFYPHNIGHYLGMDTHDIRLIPSNLQLRPGMVLTVEPGLYIPNDPSIPEQYRGIGVRIEDNVLVTDGEPEVFTKEVPKTVEEIEALMARK